MPLAILLIRMDHKEKSQKLKIAAVGLAMSGQICTFVYYFFIFYKGKQAFLTLINIMLSASQFLFVYIIAYKSSRLLNNSQYWFQILKVVGLLSFAAYLCLLLFLSLYK